MRLTGSNALMCGSKMRLCCFVMSLRARLLCSTEPSTAASRFVMDCHTTLTGRCGRLSAHRPECQHATCVAIFSSLQPRAMSVRHGPSERQQRRQPCVCRGGSVLRQCLTAGTVLLEIKLVRCVPRTALSETTRGSTAEEVSAYCSLCLSRALPGYGDVAPARSGLMN